MKKFPSFIFVGLLVWSFGAGAEAPPLIAFVGDSLTEGLGVAAEEAYPAVIEKALRAKGKPVQVLNASMSGSTSASAKSRISRLLQKKPQILVLALGANDALRGLKPAAMQSGLGEAIALARKAGTKVLLVGVHVPSPYGPKYAKEFSAVFPALKKQYSVSLLPDLLSGVFGKSELMQSDGLHPNAKGHLKMAETVTGPLEKLL